MLFTTMIVAPNIIVSRDAKYDWLPWKRSLPLHEQKQYDIYLKELRDKYPENTWRLKNNKKYYRACRQGFLQRHNNLNKFIKNNTCVQVNNDLIIK